MKYNFYHEKLEAFWQKRKWWIISALSLVVTIGIVTRFWPKSQPQKVEDAIKDYHNGKGEIAKIENLAFRVVNSTTLDTLKWTEKRDVGADYYNKALKWLRLGDEEMAERMKDSAKIFLSAADIIADELKAKGRGADNFTRCNYLAKINTSKEQYSVFVDLILDDKLRVVWVSRK